jgi:hypothetical protein
MALGLWQLAFDSLSLDDQKKLDFVRGEALPAPSVLLTKIDEKRDECQRRQWILYSNSKGEQIKIRDILDKISGTIKSFKETVDVVIQYDPGHAALPWAAVRFFLQV